MKGRIKNKPKRGRGASAAVIGRRKEQDSLKSSLRAIRRNPATRRIIAEEAELDRRITADPQLTADFEFLLKKTNWSRDTLLKRLYWDANIMHADRQTLLRKAKAEAWPIDQNTLRMTLENISALADQVERLNQMEFSPARSIMLRNKRGVELNPRDAKRLLETFRDLPEILRLYWGELRRKVEVHTVSWAEEKRGWSSLVDMVKETSLYEAIRLADSRDEYNSNRLHRLVNASREVQGLPPIELRAFVKWLNELRKWARKRSAASQAGQVRAVV